VLKGDRAAVERRSFGAQFAQAALS
jgi:hypothetical protein